MKGLIVTADDFGAAVEVNQAVETAHRDGVLTAASLMVAGPAAADAVERARRMPNLRVGLHLVLVEGRPILPASAVPDLVDETGHFRADMVQAGVAMALSRSVRRQLANEIASQFYAFQATGLPLDHVNAHKHFHLHPVIAGLIIKLGRRYGVGGARAPVEPGGVLRRVENESPPPRWGRVGWGWGSGDEAKISDGLRSRTAPFAQTPLTHPHPTLPHRGGGLAVASFATLLRNRLKHAGFTVPDHVFGLRWSGAMTTARIRGIIENLPEGLSEIYLHPATAPGFEGAAPGYRYAEELAALVSPEVIRAARNPAIKLGGFSDFGMTDTPTPEHQLLSAA